MVCFQRLMRLSAQYHHPLPTPRTLSLLDILVTITNTPGVPSLGPGKPSPHHSCDPAHHDDNVQLQLLPVLFLPDAVVPDDLSLLPQHHAARPHQNHILQYSLYLPDPVERHHEQICWHADPFLGRPAGLAMSQLSTTTHP